MSRGVLTARIWRDAALFAVAGAILGATVMAIGRAPPWLFGTFVAASFICGALTRLFIALVAAGRAERP